MHRNKSVMSHQFSMVPRADIPRSSFDRMHGHKTTFDAGFLVPVFCDEVLPGDTFNLKMTAFARMSTPIFPLMDNLYLDSFFFFVPNRLVWDNWQRFMGEQDSPGDSISYVIPKAEWEDVPVQSLADYFGLPLGTGMDVLVSALPFRAYNLIYNQWFRDENLQNAVPVPRGDGPDTSVVNSGGYSVRRRGKRHDYFTSCLPWPQKGDAVTIPLGTTAPVSISGNIRSSAVFSSATGSTSAAVQGVLAANLAASAGNPFPLRASGSGATGDVSNNQQMWIQGSGTTLSGVADLSNATAQTINSLRTAFQIQKLLERNARGGTRYTELIRAHFGVVSPDARLQRAEYLGGGTTPVTINPVAQTSGTGASGTSAPLGTLAAMGTIMAHEHGFTQSFTEHGHIIGLVNVRADLNYQQGLSRMWSRSSRYDFYFPAFANLGEQAVLNKEIYFGGGGAPADEQVFGYQERWAEYRYKPSQISGRFRSTAPTPLDGWHLAQNFTSRPVLNTTFIEERPPLDRVLAVGAAANGAQIIFDSVFSLRCARPMPMYSVPGLIDHF